MAWPAALAGPAAASSGRASQPGRTVQPGRAPVALSITAINPPYASPRAKVQVSGTLTNTSGAAISGLTVQLWSADAPFQDTGQLPAYLGGAPSDDVPVNGASWPAGSRPLRPGRTISWQIQLPAAQVKLMQAAGSGVYPLAAAVLSSAGLIVTADRTLLPYWAPQPARGAKLQKQQIAWIWPLADDPEQGTCAGHLISNHLATSLRAGGRLAGLLTAGAEEAASTHLSWAIDPALLGNAKLMASSSFQVGVSPDCADGGRLPASKSAAAWLSELKTATTGQPILLLPYADVDMTALSQNDLDADLTQAFRQGTAVASSVLGRNFAAAAGPSSASQLSGIAWPPDGLANYSLLENLAAVDGIRTVVLDAASMPPLQQLAYTPSAVASTPDGEGGDMRVLLSDHALTQILATADTATTPGAQFAVRQDFLADTAMFAVQENIARAIVVAPPRRWDPAAGLAADLLSETAAAPWLTPVSLGSLAAQPVSNPVKRRAPDNIGSGLLSASLLRRAMALDSGVDLLQSIRVHPDNSLYQAVAAAESSAWRGGPSAEQPAVARLNQVAAYVRSQERGVLILGSSRVTLGGLRGSVPVSIDNRLSYPVRVQVALRVNQPASGGFVITSPGVKMIPASTVETFKLKVRAAKIGSTTIGLSLLAPSGQALPGRYVVMTVQATQFGTVALVILAIAVGVFIITSATRGLRGRAGAPRPAAGPPDGAPAAADSADGAAGGTAGGSAGGSVGTGQANGTGAAELAGTAGQPAGADSVGPGRTAARTANAPTQDTDDLAWSPGRVDRS